MLKTEPSPFRVLFKDGKHLSSSNNFWPLNIFQKNKTKQIPNYLSQIAIVVPNFFDRNC